MLTLQEIGQFGFQKIVQQIAGIQALLTLLCALAWGNQFIQLAGGFLECAGRLSRQ
ncbi:hypothetical protein D3C76_1724750 [compost metagenome]